MYFDNSELVILTDPIPIGRYFIIEYCKIIFRYIRLIFLKPELKLRNSKYRGHFAVTRSLVEGLITSKIPFSLNPKSIKTVNTIIVLAGVKTLKQAIDLKKQKKINKLIAGPNIIVFSSDFDNLIASQEIDLCLVPSNWVKVLYLIENPSLEGRIFSWPAGVDIEKWMPGLSINKRKVILFEKHTSNKELPETNSYKDFITNKGYEIVILRYGSFTHEIYKTALKEAICLIGFSISESQGIAWSEAWASNVPTFLWENTKGLYLKKEFKCSSAPYLTDKTGFFFTEISDFVVKFEQFESLQISFFPRKWVMENMTDVVSAKLLLDKISKIQ